MKTKRKKTKTNYFYTHEATNRKIYVCTNGKWINQLLYDDNIKTYQWFSLNCCDINLDISTSFDSLQEGIEYAMENRLTVYQLNDIKELANFIREN